MKGPVETKVAASGGIGALVSLLFGLAAQYHWFAPPSPYLTALAVTVVSFLAGWLAPHTSRQVPVAIARTVTTTGTVNEAASAAVVVQPSSTAKQAP